MQRFAYIVMTSNCEAWEDYSYGVSAVFSDRDEAVKHIEKNLGMRQVQWKGERAYSRDRWEKSVYEYGEEGDFEPDEWAEALAENGGKPPVMWESKRDAWIEEYELFDKCKEAANGKR